MYHTLYETDDEPESQAGDGFMTRDVLRFFLVDFIVTAGLRLLLLVGFFPTVDSHVLAMLGGKATVFLYLLWLIRHRRRAWPETGAATAGKWWAWPLSVAIYFAATLLLRFVDVYNQHLMVTVYGWFGLAYEHKPQIAMILTFENILSLPVRMALIAMIIAVGPFFEELAFRGVGLDAYRRTGGVFRAVFWTSFLFGLYHFSLDLLIPLSLLGMVFAIARVISRSLWCSFFIHCLHNSLVLLLMAERLGLIEEILTYLKEIG